MKEKKTKGLITKIFNRNHAPIFLTSLLGILVVLYREVFYYLESFVNNQEDELIVVFKSIVISKWNYLEILFDIKMLILFISVVMTASAFIRAIKTDE
ncbi:hypothetical protein [Succinivibrio sp.]|uniref:hypothetical protein n=1 Tax=Succinivibrio sp. TaxID=2053619 RepID=UPI0038660D94